MRARKALQDVKTLAQEVRVAIQKCKSGRSSGGTVETEVGSVRQNGRGGLDTEGQM